MATRRRTEALTRERIVEAAVELLDTAGEGGLTFRALSERLATGPGALYWHVANKDELLAAATDAVIAGALTGPPATARQTPREALHAVALALYDVIDAHPWLAPQLTTQLSRRPWGPVTPRIIESLGRPVHDLGVPEDAWFTVGSVLMHYILGAAGQNAANARGLGPGADRAAVLDAVSATWQDLDPDAYPFTRAVAAQVREHDDREQYLAGIDLVLAGVTATRPGPPPPARRGSRHRPRTR